MDNFKIQVLLDQHTEEAAALLTKSFTELNDIWKSLNPSVQEIFEVMKQKVRAASGWSYGLFVDGRMIGCIINMLMKDYVKLQPIPNEPKLFKILGKYGAELEKDLKKVQWQNDTAYCLYIALLPQVTDRKLIVPFMLYLAKLAPKRGISYLYARMSNLKSYHLLKKIGAQDINNITLSEKGIQNQKIWLIRLNHTRQVKVIQTVRPKL